MEKTVEYHDITSNLLENHLIHLQGLHGFMDDFPTQTSIDFGDCPASHGWWHQRVDVEKPQEM